MSDGSQGAGISALPSSHRHPDAHRTVGYFTRLRLAAAAGLLGWLAGFLASTPAMLVVGWRDSEHDPRVFVATVGTGLFAWACWTLLLGAATWLLFAVPSALLIPPAFLVRHRLVILVLTTLLTLGAVSLKLYSFQDAAASHVLLRFILYMPYGAFAMFLAVVTAWWYIRRVAKALASSPSE